LTGDRSRAFVRRIVVEVGMGLKGAFGVPVIGGKSSLET
jgi:hypothetical protein